MPASFSEDTLIEQPAIALFGELGWDIRPTHGPCRPLPRCQKTLFVFN